MQTYQTDEFGVATLTQGTSTQPFQYTGEQRDAESGFMYLRARMCDPAIGRLLQRDPWACTASVEPLALNGYSYVESNPTTRTDPGGLMSRPVLSPPRNAGFSTDRKAEADGTSRVCLPPLFGIGPEICITLPRIGPGPAPAWPQTCGEARDACRSCCSQLEGYWPREFVEGCYANCEICANECLFYGSCRSFCWRNPPRRGPGS